MVVGNAYDVSRFHGGWQRVCFIMVVGNAYDFSWWWATPMIFRGGW